MQVQTKFIADLAVTTAKLANLAVTTGKIAANAVTGAKILLANLETLRGRNAADSADIDILFVNATDQVQSDVAWLFPTILPQSAVVPVAPEDLTNKAYVDAAITTPLVGGYEALTLNGTDITNQYKDLAEEVEPNTYQLMVGGVVQRQGIDYTLSTVGLVTRVTFAGDLATGGAAALIAGDVMYNQYLY